MNPIDKRLAAWRAANPAITSFWKGATKMSLKEVALPDALIWHVNYRRRASEEGWYLYFYYPSLSNVRCCEIKMATHKDSSWSELAKRRHLQIRNKRAAKRKFKSDAEAVQFVYDAADRGELHAVRALAIVASIAITSL